MKPHELLPDLRHYVKEIRNSRDVETNWPAFKRFVEQNQNAILSDFSLKWLKSICDTYADHGGEIERRDALAISNFMNLIRFAETVAFVRGPMDPERVGEVKSEFRKHLYDDLFTISIDKQDVFLNVAKRMARQMQGAGFMERMWREVQRRFLEGDNIITEFRDMSEMPERYFPLDPLDLPDNYGIK